MYTESGFYLEFSPPLAFKIHIFPFSWQINPRGKLCRKQRASIVYFLFRVRPNYFIAFTVPGYVDESTQAQ